MKRTKKFIEGFQIPKLQMLVYYHNFYKKLLCKLNQIVFLLLPSNKNLLWQSQKQDFFSQENGKKERLKNYNSINVLPKCSMIQQKGKKLSKGEERVGHLFLIKKVSYTFFGHTKEPFQVLTLLHCSFILLFPPTFIFSSHFH